MKRKITLSKATYAELASALNPEELWLQEFEKDDGQHGIVLYALTSTKPEYITLVIVHGDK